MMKKRILVVDDEVGALTLIGIMLERGGFGVLKAKDGLDALAVLEQNLPDMIILDVMMPGMDGITLCGVIRKQRALATVPILILSARNDADSVMRGMEAGANDYLPKPILHHDLVQKVKLMVGIPTPKSGF
ncbi:MAG: response regulator [Armatimonadetes bacterium]|nr:response regulator [Anaerolineae bacterium]